MKGFEPRREQTPEEIEREVMKVIAPTLRPVVDLDRCAGCGASVGDFEAGGFEREDGQRGHFACVLEAAENYLDGCVDLLQNVDIPVLRAILKGQPS